MGILDPQTQGLLQAAFAGLAASGPSRMPVGLGQVLGGAGSAGLAGYDQAQKLQSALALQDIETKLKKAQLDKITSDAEFQRQIMSGSMGDILKNPDLMQAIGTKLSVMGKEGGAAWLTAASHLRKQMDEATQFAAMKSPAAAPVASLGAGDLLPSTEGKAFTNPSLETVPAEERGLFDAALNQARATNVAARGEGGLFAGIQGPEGRRMQGLLNAAPTANPEQWMRHYERALATQTAQQTREDAAAERALNLPKSEHIIQDKTSDTGWSYEDTRSGKITKGAPPPSTGAAAVGDVIPPEHKDLHGQDYLDTLPTGMAALVKSIASGAVDPSKAASLRYGNREAITQRVLQYDPTYKATRAKVYQGFMDPNGKTAQNLVAMNTVVSHLGTLNDMTDALQNKDLKAYNAVANRLAVEIGRPEVNNFDIAKQAVGNELMRVFRQVQASEHETKDWEAKFSAASSPAQLKGAIRTGVELLKGRLDAVNDQWKRSMETDQDFPVLSEKSKQVLARIGITGAGIPLSAPVAPPTQRRRYNPATGRIE